MRRTSTRLLRCRSRWHPWERQAYFAANAPRSIRDAAGRKKMAATRLTRCLARWRPWGRPACIRAAAPRRGKDSVATRLLRLRTWWRPWDRQARRRRGLTASSEVTANRAAARSSAGSVKKSDSAQIGSQTRYVRQLASCSGTGAASGVVCDYRRCLKGCCAVNAGAGSNLVKVHYTEAWQ
jgi:hypothetical protein